MARIKSPPALKDYLSSPPPRVVDRRRVRGAMVANQAGLAAAGVGAVVTIIAGTIAYSFAPPADDWRDFAMWLPMAFPMLFVLAGLLVMMGGVHGTWRLRKLLAHGRLADARVTALKTLPLRSDPSTDDYEVTATFTFTDGPGHATSFKLHVPPGEASQQVYHWHQRGTVVPVLYDPGRPQNASVVALWRDFIAEDDTDEAVAPENTAAAGKPSTPARSGGAVKSPWAAALSAPAPRTLTPAMEHAVHAASGAWTVVRWTGWALLAAWVCVLAPYVPRFLAYSVERALDSDGHATAEGVVRAVEPTGERDGYDEHAPMFYRWRFTFETADGKTVEGASVGTAAPDAPSFTPPPGDPATVEYWPDWPQGARIAGQRYAWRPDAGRMAFDSFFFLLLVFGLSIHWVAYTRKRRALRRQWTALLRDGVYTTGLTAQVKRQDGPPIFARDLFCRVDFESAPGVDVNTRVGPVRAARATGERAVQWVHDNTRIGILHDAEDPRRAMVVPLLEAWAEPGIVEDR